MHVKEQDVAKALGRGGNTAPVVGQCLTGHGLHRPVQRAARTRPDSEPRPIYWVWPKRAEWAAEWTLKDAKRHVADMKREGRNQALDLSRGTHHGLVPPDGSVRAATTNKRPDPNVVPARRPMAQVERPKVARVRPARKVSVRVRK